MALRVLQSKPWRVTVAAGSNLTDTYSGSSHLDGDPDPEARESYFNNHHKYAVLWEPGEYVRWYLDDLLLYEVGKEALSAKVGAGKHILLIMSHPRLHGPKGCSSSSSSSNSIRHVVDAIQSQADRHCCPAHARRHRRRTPKTGLA
jgi:hypothetical protein